MHRSESRDFIPSEKKAENLKFTNKLRGAFLVIRKV